MEPQDNEAEVEFVGTVCSIMHCYKTPVKEGNPFPIPLCEEHVETAKKWTPPEAA